MKSKGVLLEEVALRGLEIAPSQSWGGIRLVPLLRRDVHADLRLALRRYDESLTVVSLDSSPAGLKYASYIPHGMVMTWSDDSSVTAAYGTQLEAADGKRLGNGVHTARLTHRMVRREDKNQLRFMPLHMAMEGYLALHFGGPTVVWSEYSRQAVSHGLDPRSESSVSGWAIRGLDDALRVFEIHTRQVGVLVFVADALASAFVVPHPADYAALHRSLIEDFYGELLYHYASYATSSRHEAEINDARVGSLADLRRELEGVRAEWSLHHADMSRGILGRSIQSERVYRAGQFQLQRFITSLSMTTENHIGEAIVRDSGELEYLKTYRLSAAQSKRAYLLQQLAAQNWNLDATASALGQSRQDLIERIAKAGFGYLLKPHVLEEARRRR